MKWQPAIILFVLILLAGFHVGTWAKSFHAGMGVTSGLMAFALVIDEAGPERKST